MSMKLFLLPLLILYTLYLIPHTVYARTTPEDIVNAKQQEYQGKITSYSEQSKSRLKLVSDKIIKLNQDKTIYLSWIMESQARILDEYEQRFSNKNQEAIEDGRYWITYAHEAVAYQAAKIYIFDLRSESVIEADIKNTVTIFKSDLDSARGKVIKSQKILEGIIK